MKRFLIPALVALFIIDCGFLGHASYSGYKQAKIVYNTGHNIEYGDSYQEGIVTSAIPHENLTSGGQTSVYTEPQTDPVIHPEADKEVYPTEFRQFESQDELSKWQAKQYPELQELGRQNNWICVDYALEMQRRAWLDGYQMSTENLLDKGGKTGHAICSTWIGDECIYLEPQSTISWVGAVKGDGGLMNTPILIYPETGQVVYREE